MLTEPQREVQLFVKKRQSYGWARKPSRGANHRRKAIAVMIATMAKIM
jgi:hypothetical protein